MLGNADSFVSALQDIYPGLDSNWSKAVMATFNSALSMQDKIARLSAKISEQNYGWYPKAPGDNHLNYLNSVLFSLVER